MRKFIIFILMTILLFTLCMVSVSAEETSEPFYNEDVHIFDNANLFTSDEEALLIEQMHTMDVSGGVAVITVEYNTMSTEDYAREQCYHIFGRDGSGMVFVIDMDNREIYIYADGTTYDKIDRARCYEITDNVYKYATKGEYYMCTSKALEMCVSAHNGNFFQFVFSPLRIITGIIIGFSCALLIKINDAFKQRKINLTVGDVTENKRTFKVTKTVTMTHQTKTYHDPSSSSSGGGGFSGGGGGGGGGHSF